MKTRSRVFLRRIGATLGNLKKGVAMPEWLDNLIPMKAPELTREQLAGWRPTRAAAEGLGCRLFADQRIEVAGGVTLSADVYTPRAPGRYPAIVQFAAYTRELHTAGAPTGSNEIGSPPVFTARGYVQVVVERRGMGRSDGTQNVFLVSRGRRRP
ncbi:CocE/NonD family hydrolase [Methylocystis sp. H4A]|uniref:CocE/NonD family hydrolase n=1 Tax=Methylocystis sp. H4A TaxID=2785788 RepID=UPI0032B1A531